MLNQSISNRFAPAAVLATATFFGCAERGEPQASLDAGRAAASNVVENIPLEHQPTENMRKSWEDLHASLKEASKAINLYAGRQSPDTRAEPFYPSSIGDLTSVLRTLQGKLNGSILDEPQRADSLELANISLARIASMALLNKKIEVQHEILGRLDPASLARGGKDAQKLREHYLDLQADIDEAILFFPGGETGMDAPQDIGERREIQGARQVELRRIFKNLDQTLQEYAEQQSPLEEKDQFLVKYGLEVLQQGIKELNRVETDPEAARNLLNAYRIVMALDERLNEKPLGRFNANFSPEMLKHYQFELSCYRRMIFGDSVSKE